MKTYSGARLAALKEKAHRLNLLVRDVSERCREAEAQYQRAVTIRDTGSVNPRHDWGEPVRRFPDAATQKKNEEAVADWKEKHNHLRAERDRLTADWQVAGQLVQRCEAHISKLGMEAHDKPKAEESRFKPKLAKEDFQPVII